MSTPVVFSSAAWDEYLAWQHTDRAGLKRIHQLIQAIQRAPFEGVGKPEPLKHNLAGWWSRRITDEHRLVYRMVDGRLEIARLRYHYQR